MNVTPDHWLTGVMDTAAYRVSAEDSDATALAETIARTDAGFFYAKVGAKQIPVVRTLAGVGMFVVDVNVTFERNAAEANDEPQGEVEVGASSEEDAESVLAIAESAYEYSRFHLDPLVPAGLANRIKREWCGSYVRGDRGDRLFVARLHGQPVGFLAALTTAGDHRAAVIDLVGVRREQRKRRVGTALVRAFLGYYQSSVRTVRVGTQVANIPSVRLYERLGFSLVDSQYVLHLHVRRGRPVT
jgi:ribosomal protein S18 acetylase RimI-like enzyme